MPSLTVTRAAFLAAAIAVLSCGRNTSEGAAGAAPDTTITADVVDSNQTESGVTDSTGQSTLGEGVERSRPDQGQPVTSKGDTLNPGVDSSTAPQ
jgi:hypothetical protein